MAKTKPKIPASRRDPVRLGRKRATAQPVLHRTIKLEGRWEVHLEPDGQILLYDEQGRCRSRFKDVETLAVHFAYAMSELDDLHLLEEGLKRLAAREAEHLGACAAAMKARRLQQRPAAGTGRGD